MNDWHRLEQVVKWTGLSVNSFALNIGLKRSENLYQIKKGNNGISRDLAELTAKKYPAVSKGWLLSGEGDMFIGQTAIPSSTKGIPYFSVEAIQAIEENQQGEPQYHIDIPTFYDCDLAALSLGTVMQPDIPAGAIVVLKKWPLTSIVPGEPYLVVTPYFKGIRIVRLSPEKDQLQLLPRNAIDYDSITIAKKEIIKLYLVRGIIINNNI